MTTRKKADPETDFRSAPSGDALKHWAFMWNSSLEPIAEFIASVEKGVTPTAESMKPIAKAMRAFFCHRDLDASLTEFAQSLGLPRKQGKRVRTVREASEDHIAASDIAFRFVDLSNEGLTKSKAQAQALKEYAQEHGKPLRTVQSWWKANAESALALNRIVDAFVKKRATKSRG